MYRSNLVSSKFYLTQKMARKFDICDQILTSYQQYFCESRNRASGRKKRGQFKAWRRRVNIRRK